MRKMSLIIIRVAVFMLLSNKYNFGFAQQQYLAFDEVVFATELEKQTLQKLVSGQGDIIDGFLIISIEDSSQFSSWKRIYAREIETLKQRKKSKKIRKDVKYIYDKVHDKFLTKYNHLAYFDQIFETGIYNCVTAVALYAMAFEEFGIPYHIKETPTHVS